MLVDKQNIRNEKISFILIILRAELWSNPGPPMIKGSTGRELLCCALCSGWSEFQLHNALNVFSLGTLESKPEAVLTKSAENEEDEAYLCILYFKDAD